MAAKHYLLRLDPWHREVIERRRMERGARSVREYLHELIAEDSYKDARDDRALAVAKSLLSLLTEKELQS